MKPPETENEKEHFFMKIEFSENTGVFLSSLAKDVIVKIMSRFKSNETN